ncbi:MAG: 2-C-methyl-D-erythritol 2,4-cyclodiphosphate synthase [Planctomycetota bacterium]|nr:2-C-methyl-D-erythritol 2,4-cyclodiphosphate synthase [Planctomycetota bacterium]
MVDSRRSSEEPLEPEIRVGVGTDRHRLEPGRALVLCGVEIPAPHGPVAHSDGDVALHAICDAMLGACACPDIGTLFPDTDPQWQGVASSRLLANVLAMVSERGWRPQNVDVVVHLEQPRLQQYRDQFCQRLAELLKIPVGAVGWKAKTGEGVGPVGESLVIDSVAIVQLVSEESK